MLLIKHGLLHTMSDAGIFEGDILLNKDKITQIAPQISIAGMEQVEVIDAKGLQVCPGLIDTHLHAPDGHDNIPDLCRDAVLAGITTQGVWAEHQQSYSIWHGTGEPFQTHDPILCVQLERCTEVELHDILREAASRNMRVGCEISSPLQLCRILHWSNDAGCRLVLAHLTGCTGMVDEIVASGCEVIMGACALRSEGNAYEFAAELSRRGLTISLTSDYPATRMQHLPLCAGLCMRSGMSHLAAMQSMTINAARLMRVDNVCGSLEIGKQADLVFFDGDPLMLASAMVMIISNGRIIKKS